MPLFVSNHAVTDDYNGTNIGNAAGVYQYGTLIVADNPVSVLFYHGGTGGQSSELEIPYLLPGTYPLFGTELDYIVGLKIKNYTAGSAATVTCFLFEPGRAGLAPTAVVNPLASSGIEEITSVDGSVTIVNPFGPITDLSVPGFGDFLHWGVNTDAHSFGLSLQGDGVFDFTTNGHVFSMDTGLNASIRMVPGTPGSVTIDGYGSTIVAGTGVAGTSILSTGLIDIAGLSAIQIEAIQDILIKSVNAFHSGHSVSIEADQTVALRGRNITLDPSGFGAPNSPIGKVIATIPVTQSFRINSAAGPTLFDVIAGGGQIDCYVPVAVYGPTGATALTRYAGATTTGTPASGTFATGDFVVAQDGHIYVCTAGGSPGTWQDVGTASGVPSTRTLTAGSGLSGGGNLSADRTFDVNVDSSTIVITADTLKVATDGITSNEIAAGAVGSSELASTAVTPATYGSATKVGQFTVDADGRLTAASEVTISGTVPAAGGFLLVYRYTVTGSDKASIDTGVDTPDAGSNDWTGGDLLLMILYSRTDEAVTNSIFDIILNNDTGAVYDRQAQGVNNNTQVGGTSLGQTKWQLITKGANAPASFFGVAKIEIPNYTGTVGFKMGHAQVPYVDSTAASSEIDTPGLMYRSANAISRYKASPTTAGKKFKVGTQLLVLKSVSS